MIRLAMFDCDGTLVDSQKRIVGAMQAAWTDQNLAPPEAEAVRQVVGLALPRAIAALAPAHADAALLAALTESFRQTFRRLSTDPAYDEPLYPGVTDALDRLAAADVVLGVATGKGRRGLLKTLDRHGLAARFSVLKTADDGPSKPHPQILEDAMAEMAAAPATTVMLGDTSFDMAMATSAGAHALGVAWGYHTAADLERHGARQVLQAFDAAPAAILDLLGTGP